MSPTRVSLSMVASRQSPPLFPLAKSLYSVNPERLQPVAGGVAASGEPVPVCDRVRHGSRPGAPAACPAGSHTRSRCADAPVVTIHIGLNQAPRIVQSQRRERPDTFLLERLVPTFDLAIRLRIIR